MGQVPALEVEGQGVADDRVVAVVERRGGADREGGQRHDREPSAEADCGRHARKPTAASSVSCPTVSSHAAPDAVAPPPGNPRFPLFDGLRAIAAGSILVTHVAAITSFNRLNALGAYTARLNMGVAFFFVISGFLLYRPFLAARFAGRPPPRSATMRAGACCASCRPTGWR